MDFVSVLRNTLSADAATRKQAEATISEAQKDLSQFPQLALSVVQTNNEPPVQLSAAIAFKNWVKNYWDDAVPAPIVASLRQEIVALTLQAPPRVQAQLTEAISLMAVDYPSEWEDLVQQLVSLFSEDYVKNNVLLSIAHSVFARWRPAFHSDALEYEIIQTLEVFCAPYLALFVQLDQRLSSDASQTSTYLRTLYLLLELYYDLNCQDFPAFFEDNLPQMMALLLKYIEFTPAGVDPDDDEETDVERSKGVIFDIGKLYAVRYTEEFTALQQFIEKTWAVLTQLPSTVKYDAVVSKAIAFLSVVVRLPSQKELFLPALASLTENIILPNMALREFEEELFEDDPAEYVRRDLEAATDSDTRRQAASGFTKALLDQFEAEITSIVTTYVQQYLALYAESPVANWKSKDTAIFLLTSIASLGATTRQGVTSTNALVDVVSFFSEHVYADFSADAAQVHPIIQADAIKFLYTFRNQLTKEQLLSVMPLLDRHVRSSNYVIHTYAALTIERILFIKHNGQFLFSPQDIEPFLNPLLQALFGLIESASSPEQMSANDALMRCIMRLLATARATLIPIYRDIFSHLVNIITQISKNPSNPKFSHYTFESVSTVLKYCAKSDPSILSACESGLFPTFEYILTNDVAEFAPFVFQILSQMLEMHPQSEFPQLYKNILPPFLTPTLWESKGNVPALIRLFRAFLSHGSDSIVANNQLSAILGMYQALIATRANDIYAFELMQSVIEFVPLTHIQSYLSSPIALLMLNKLNVDKKTERYRMAFLKFVCYVACIRKDDWSLETLYNMFEGVQPNPGLFAQVLGVLLPETTKVAVANRKIVLVGLTHLLTETPLASNALLLQTLVTLVQTSVAVVKNTSAADADDELPDLEELGYQASFSKLGASDAPPADVTQSYIPAKTNFDGYFGIKFAQSAAANPALAQTVSALAPDVQEGFKQYLAKNSISL